jgi:KipI family sensor histidine kinase inhibitor
LHPQLHIKRKNTPSARVPAGSVAIGGSNTGIYPSESPGGWHIIGRTSVTLFDAQAQQPCLLKPGDTVRFIAQKEKQL